MTTCVLETTLVVGGCRHSGVISTEFNDPVELIRNLPTHRERSLSPDFAFTSEESATIQRLFTVLDREIHFYAYGGEIGLWRTIAFDDDKFTESAITLELRVRPK